MITAGVDEHGTPLLEAIAINNKRSVDHALYLAACSGFIQAVDLLLDAGVGLLGVSGLFWRPPVVLVTLIL